MLTAPRLCVIALLLLAADGRGLYEAPHESHNKLGSRQHCTAQGMSLLEEGLLKDPKALGAYISAIPRMSSRGTWLQIGANTLDPKGSTYQVDDPLLRYLPSFSDFRKVFVEPVPPLFEQLKKHTQNIPNADLVNAAIVPGGTPGGTVTMYCPPAEDMQQWLTGICSMDEGIINRILPGKQARKFEVQALTVNELFKSHAIQDVKVVMIDTEGFDVKLLKLLPFDRPRFRPDLVVFEHTEISGNEHVEGMEFLRSHCYMLAFDRENTYGIRLG